GGSWSSTASRDRRRAGADSSRRFRYPAARNGLRCRRSRQTARRSERRRRSRRSAVLELLRELVEIESPSYSPGTRAVAERVARELEPLGATVVIDDGGHLGGELPGEGAPLLVSGHVDTVW